MLNLFVIGPLSQVIRNVLRNNSTIMSYLQNHKSFFFLDLMAKQIVNMLLVSQEILLYALILHVQIKLHKEMYYIYLLIHQ